MLHCKKNFLKVKFEAPVGYKEHQVEDKTEEISEEKNDSFQEDTTTFSGERVRLDGKKKKEIQSD